MTISANTSLAALLVVGLALVTATAASAAPSTPAQSNQHVSAEAKVGFNPQPDPPGKQALGDGSVRPAAATAAKH